MKKSIKLRPNIRCFFENLTVDYNTFSAFHSADKFLNEQQIFGLVQRGKSTNREIEEFSSFHELTKDKRGISNSNRQNFI